MFDDIHEHYDLLNSILSFGQDNRWRRKAVEDLPDDGTLIDLCSGGGELTRELLRRSAFSGHIILADIALSMIGLSKKILPLDFRDRIFPVVCDVENLPFKNGVFTSAMSAFSLRNLADLETFTAEVLRVLHPNGIARYLEIGHPRNLVIGALFRLYFYHISPFIAALFTRKTYAYRYLPASLKSFPRQWEVLSKLSRGWSRGDFIDIQGGIAAIYHLEKAQDDHE
jgi:demethylmenaquinone methyltransferase/2-methoxy-6-polyprenyl-1,4-benzoquinol methylase